MAGFYAGEALMSVYTPRRLARPQGYTNLWNRGIPMKLLIVDEQPAVTEGLRPTDERLLAAENFMKKN